MALTSGTRLGTYEIVAPLGAGGMGEVYRALDTRLGRHVALKVLPREVAGSADRLARFEREARVVAGLNHPNIVVLYSVEDDGDTRFLTMELVEGTSLGEAIVPKGLPVPRIVELGIALADALTAAHERGVVHRDLKPANVMLSRDGRVKVLDFGLAKPGDTPSDRSATHAATMTTPMSSPGQVLGTAPYMAPEQIRGEASDARTDLFALGILLYELASGHRPFTGATAADVTSAILRDAPPSLSGIRADLPIDFTRIVERCLEKDPRLRFQTALDVCNELRRVKRSLDSAPPAASSTDVASIAVLPFVNRSRSEDDEYFADGLADEMLGLLAKIRGLRVAARSSSATFKGKAVTVGEVGRALNVAAVLEGSVRKAGDRVRISVQLVKVADGYHLWSETYDRTLDDIFAVQDDIAQSVVKELRTALLGEQPDSGTSGEAKADVARAAKGRGTDAEAHRLYLQGRFFSERLTGEDYARGIASLRLALERDPNYALAWAALTRALVFQAGHGFAPVTETNAEARAAAERAIELEPDLPEAHLAMTQYQIWHGWDWKRGDAAVKRALALAPDDSDVLRIASLFAFCTGRVEESLVIGRRAVEQNPLDASGFVNLARSYSVLGRSNEAEMAYRKALDLSPKGVSIRFALALALLDQGRVDDALSEVEAEPSRWAHLCGLAVVHDVAGRTAQSEKALHDLIAESGDTSAYQIAMIYANRGDRDRAFEWLDRAYADRDSGLSVLRPSRWFRNLHDDPRWPAFLRRLGNDA